MHSRTEPHSNEKLLVAPCGMNCSLCLGYLRSKNKCSGCRINGPKPGYCTTCIIINCPVLAETESGFCYDCSRYPCKRLKQLDKRYTAKYNTSFIGNLESIRSNGIDKFIKSEKARWHCNSCGGTVCIHRGYCLSCSK